MKNLSSKRNTAHKLNQLEKSLQTDRRLLLQKSLQQMNSQDLEAIFLQNNAVQVEKKPWVFKYAPSLVSLGIVMFVVVGGSTFFVLQGSNPSANELTSQQTEPTGKLQNALNTLTAEANEEMVLAKQVDFGSETIESSSTVLDQLGASINEQY